MVSRSEKRFPKTEKPDGKIAAAAAKPVAGAAAAAPDASPSPGNTPGATPNVQELFARLMQERAQTNDRHARETTQMHGRHAKDHKDLAARHAEEIQAAMQGASSPAAGGAAPVQGA